ncbi:DUF748 domain-containing protein [Mitsuaria sp. GD03876]|uniref:DUF748 domain-containing protein n=1 Tax=Mitsuaria sp. GD03876 TaxID=2975399 RepID=UPI00244C7CFF|nr:DUF748 domain-containing protein [Mitsuaria sp. GD03876]MDH0866669.1 DUF748 domain-containing protein [Mitsuaria sp. GD03876]
MLRALVGLVLFLVALLLVAWVALPMWIERVGVRIASEELGRPVTLGRASFTPWRLALSLEELKIAGPTAAAPPLLEIKRVGVALSPRSLWHLAPVLSSLTVDSPRVRVALLPDGKTDLDDIVARLSAAPQTPPKADDGPAEAAVYNIELTDGEFRLDDRAAGMVHELKALHLGIPFLSTLDADVEVHVQPRLSGQLNGVGFQSEGEARPFADTRSASMTVKLDALDLSAYRAYWPKALPMRLAKGLVDAQLTVDFKQPPTQAPEVKLSGRTAVRALSLQRRVDGGAGAAAEGGWEDWLRWQALTIDLANVQPLKRQLLLGAVSLKQPELLMGRDAQGRLWLPDFAAATASTTTAAPKAAPKPAPAPSGAASGAAKGAAPAGPWRVGVQQLALEGGRIGWTDESLRPAATWRVDGLSVKGSGLGWPLAAKAAPVEIAATVAPEGAKSAASLSGKGEVGAAGVVLEWALKDLALDGLSPYLKAATPLSLQGSFATQGAVRAGPNGEDLRLSLKALSLDGLQLADGKKPVLSLKQLSLDQAELALDSRKLTAGRLALVAPKAQLGRDKAGKWSWDAWTSASATPAGQGAAAASRRRAPESRGDRLTLDAPERAEVAAAPGAGAPWTAQVAEVAIEGGEATLLDLATHVLDDEPARPIGVQELALKVSGIDWDGRQLRKALPAQLSATLRRPDATRRATRDVPRFQWNGQVALAPLKVSGKVNAEHLPLHWADPYLDPTIGIHLQRAEGSMRGGFEFAETPKGPSVRAGGELLIADLRLRQARLQEGRRRSAEDLLSWQGLKLGGLRVALAPGGAPDVKIQQAVLDEFYARLIVNEQGRLNLRDLNQTEQGQAVAAVAGTPAASAPVAATVAQATSAPAPTAASAAASSAAGEPPLRLSIAETRLNGGKVDFNDRFIKPNYSANLSELTGTLGAFAAGSAAMAPLQLKGKVEGTGLLDISGQLNPSGAPLALDITASATDIELAPLSPYAGKYAGYAIERGKLSTRVHYQIEPGGRLQADNKIVLNQLTFGDRIDSPTATKLPVKLAVALLKDRDGVIDVNLPVSGSLNDPQFSVGGLVVKLILNLLAKALTAPFSLLSGGGGAEMSQLEFRPGTAALAPEAAKKLEPLTKVLGDKPSLQLSITGWVDPQAERRAAQAARLEEALVAERRRELRRSAFTQAAAPAASGAGSDASAAPVELDDAQRARLLKTVYDNAKLPGKPRNFLGLAKDIPAEQMRALLMDSYTVTDEQLRELALQRAVAVRDALIERGVANARMFLASPKLHAAGDDRGDDKDKPWQPRVDLALSAQ